VGYFAVATPGQAVETIAKSAIMIEATTGAVLLQKQADTPMAPASMSKLMTLFILFERLKEGSLSLTDTFRVSENAWRKGGAKSGSSTMFLPPKLQVSIEDLIRGIIVQSGNDACIVIAEGISGSESAFADEMTVRGREIGLTGSTFKNSTGWPDPEHLMTLRDLAHLSRRLISDFPDFYHYFAELEFSYNGIRQSNRNPLLYKDLGVDGLKTGHTQVSGYGLAASAIRKDRRLILVVNGLDTRKDRSREPERLLELGFRDFNNYKLFKAGEHVGQADIWLGKSASVPLIVEKALTLTLPRRGRRQMKVAIQYRGPVAAPVLKGTQIGKLVVSVPGISPIEVPLVAAVDVQRLGFIGRILAVLQSILWGQSI